LGTDPETLLGHRVGSVQRRGKYLWLPLEQAGGLLMHLGMSGSLAFLDGTPAAGAHDHFDLHTDRGLLRLTDPRRFGAVVWAPALDAEPVATLLGGLGLEPFDERFDGLHLHAALGGRRVAIKQALLAGDIVVGAGNIYACEALFAAGIDPRLPAGRLSRPRAERPGPGGRRHDAARFPRRPWRGRQLPEMGWGIPAPIPSDTGRNVGALPPVQSPLTGHRQVKLD